ncbi:hypothetical protein INT48_004536 [Thamnidium elegans]|uniref:Uncharacterized protein n=1 Tax=Thamnidium elegans TaxID=101142 RepID=A0A8H7T054_9FUNG|nr:hypothetical protein INT48_004536 [Thamnidium elegans]
MQSICYSGTETLLISALAEINSTSRRSAAAATTAATSTSAAYTASSEAGASGYGTITITASNDAIRRNSEDILQVIP